MDNLTPHVLAATHEFVTRDTTDANRPTSYKVIGLVLAICSGLFIGTSFVLKKHGLLKANEKYHEEAGEGYGYLKNLWWWTGMTLMIVGEICNFVAYAFTDAILVTPLGALSVVVTTILSAIFLKERLSFVGKIGCFNCIVGSVVIVMNAPSQSAVANIQEMKSFVIAPGFLSYAGVIIVGCAFIAFWVGPRYGKKSMLVYLSICSLIGGLSVVATQGLGSAVVAQAGGTPQFNQWFLYVLLVFVVATLLTEIIYLNKALNLFNAALVTPTYYVFFTSATIVTSSVLFRGFKGTPLQIATVIMGFLQICAGVVLLQMSKSAKDVPDAAVFSGDLGQMREIAEQEQPETEPKADALRGTAAIIRRFSVSRQKMEEEEARRLREDKLKDRLEPLREGEVVEWDGLRRRKTVVGLPSTIAPTRRKTIHPPLGMSKIPDPNEEVDEGPGIFEEIRRRASTMIPRHAKSTPVSDPELQGATGHPVPMTNIKAQMIAAESPATLHEEPMSSYDMPTRKFAGAHQEPDAFSPHMSPMTRPGDKAMSPTIRPVTQASRQFSFTNILHRNQRSASADQEHRRDTHSRGSSRKPDKKRDGAATEEERLGLVKGDSHLPSYAQEPEEYDEDDEDSYAPPPVPRHRDLTRPGG